MTALATFWAILGIKSLLQHLFTLARHKSCLKFRSRSLRKNRRQRENRGDSEMSLSAIFGVARDFMISETKLEGSNKKCFNPFIEVVFFNEPEMFCAQLRTMPV